MLVPEWLEASFINLTDRIYARIPRQQPPRKRLDQCKIVSHRGEFDNTRVFENTLAAITPLIDAGVWGIECDLRWTRDLHPVVFHDADLKRLFGDNRRIAALTRAELRQDYPMVPGLEEVIDAVDGKLHLMLEIKREMYPDQDHQNRMLGSLFSGLRPCQDYHILTLTPDMFDVIHFAPKQSFLPIAQVNLPSLSRLALEKEYGGVSGHFLFMTAARIKSHKDRGQQVGTGFIASQNCLFREINRGVDWIFSNDAARMQAILHACH